MTATRDKWVFTILDPPEGELGTAAVMDAETVIVGRIPEADVRLPWDGQVSRLHARFECVADQVTIADLRSANGTFILEGGQWRAVNGVEPVVLPVEVRIGNTRLRVEHTRGPDTDEGPLPSELLVSVPERIDDRKLVEAMLILDLCGSSTLADRAGDEMAYHIKTRLITIRGSVFAQHAPQYVKNTGDGFFATFRTADEAFAAAILLVRRLRLRNSNTRNPPIDVRIGLHHGETFLMQDGTPDRHGSDLNIAFRLEGVEPSAFADEPHVNLPDKNRVLASTGFLRALTSGAQAFGRLGMARLRGIREPVELHIYRGQTSFSAEYRQTMRTEP